MRPRWFAHVDMDAFYASVEILDRPELEGLPVAVGGPADSRGVIAAASYAAREFGVRSAMPTAQALRRCPQLILLPGRMSRYQEKSGEFMGALREFAPAVEPLSLDEAFMDLTGCQRLHGDWADLGLRLRQRIREVTGLSCSIGMGETRRIAKIASDLRKPAGLVVVEAGGGEAFLRTMPLERLWGVGPRFREQLLARGIRSAADIAERSRSQLQSSFGRAGLALHDMVHAKETGGVDPARTNRSISHETTFSKDHVGIAQLEPALLHFAERVGTRLRRRGLQGRVVQLKIRDRGFHTFTRRCTLSHPTDLDTVIYEHAHRMLIELGWDGVHVRLIGVGVHQLSEADARQGNLFSDAHDREELQIDRTLDAVYAKFGEGSIGRARSFLRGDTASWQKELYGPLESSPEDDEHSASPRRAPSRPATANGRKDP